LQDGSKPGAATEIQEGEELKSILLASLFVQSAAATLETIIADANVAKTCHGGIYENDPLGSLKSLEPFEKILRSYFEMMDAQQNSRHCSELIDLCRAMPPSRANSLCWSR
jgi:hypothetical protein